MSEEKSPAPAVDLPAILAEVEASLEVKKAQGLYDPAEVRRVEEAAVAFNYVEDEPAALMKMHQAKLVELWDPLLWGVTTHRAGVAARLILWLKKIIFKLSAFPRSVWFARQSSFNDEVVKLVKVLLPVINNLRSRMPRVEKRLDDVDALEQELARMSPRFESVLAQMTRLVERQAEAAPAVEATAREVARLRFQSRGDAYLRFENAHRGAREMIKQRQAVYLPYFVESVSPGAPLVDLGCGRGEFLEAAREAGLAAKGVELNPQMVELCRKQGLEVVQAEALEYLRGLEDATLGGVLMAQLIEHLTHDELSELISLAAAKLKPGGWLIAETVNPACLTTFSGAFYLDLSHTKPIHSEAARFLWQWAGLKDVDILLLSPYPDDYLLRKLPGEGPLVEAFNHNVKRLNDLLYGPQDYAVVGRR
ncbi:MAG: methyltransferase domain-containing protein [Thermodesulfobacteriota bacterium]